jgi:hypothetical protein
MAEKSERATGTPNTIYDLSSVLFHALEGGASYDMYIRDAEESGDQGLAAFFRRVRDEDATRADEARQLLAKRTLAAERAKGETSDASPRPNPSTDLPGTEPIPEEVAPEVLRPEGARPGEREAPPPPRTAGIEGGVLGRTEEIPPTRTPDTPDKGPIPPTEEAVPPRTQDVPLAEEVPSGTPPQAPPGDVQRGTSPRIGGTQRAEEEREEGEGLIDKVRDFLRGEGGRRNYTGDDDRER